MANYTKSTNFTAKDALSSGDPAKLIKGSEVDPEFDNIATAISTKADKTAPAVSNNVATLGGGGSLQDGGYRFSALTGEITVSTTEMNNLAPFPSGTKVLFAQTTPPVGWTKDTTHNDKALRVVTGSVGNGGTLAFSTWAATAATDSYTLLEADIPDHRHFIAAAVDDANSSSSLNNTQQVYRDGGPDSSNREYRLSPTATEATVGRTSPTGGDGGHSHGLDMDLQYVDVIIATRD